jgi:RNA polymerase sigma-70 factor (ECF subfamily)
MPVFENDRRLLEAFRRGERAALKHVFEKTFATVDGLLEEGFAFSSGEARHRFRGCRDRDERMELVAEVYCAAYEPSARAAYDGVRPYLPFLLQIARNKVIDRFRARGREFEPLAGDPADAVAALPAPGEDAEAALVVGEEREQVRRYVEGLPPREREVFELRVKEDLPREEVERRTGLSTSQIRTSEKRLLDGLRRFLAALGWVEP